LTPESTVISAAPEPYDLRKSRVSISAPACVAPLAGVLAEVVISAGIFAQNFYWDLPYLVPKRVKNHIPICTI
jgi:hypothetical protein